MLGSSVAFESLLSLSTIALFVLYAGKCAVTGIHSNSSSSGSSKASFVISRNHSLA
jgi:hypothetical protein